MKWSLVILWSCLSVALVAQPYGNEWIDYDKTYYKLTLTENGLYRITYEELLDHYNESDLIGSDFQLFGQAQEVMIYTTTDGQFSAGDYIEFFGARNNGVLDIPLYKSGEDLHPYYSLYNDESAYFLTLNPGGNNLRFTTVANDPTGLPIEPYFWDRALKFFIDDFNSGAPSAGGSLQVLRDSYYSEGEGWTGSPFNGPATRNRNLTTDDVYRGDPALQAILEHVHVTKSFQGSHSSQLTVGGTTFNYEFSGFGVRKIVEQFPLADVTSGTTTVSYRENNNVRVADALVAITYPRIFDLGGTSQKALKVETTSAVQLQFSDFNPLSSTPVLLDRANGQRYVAQVNGSRYDFGLTAVSNPRDMLITHQDPSQITEIADLEQVEFKNYFLPENQGDYILLSHQSLQQSDDGTDYVEAYANYRASPAGGSYEVSQAWIRDIENQFGWGVRNHPQAIRNFINFAIDNFRVVPGHIFIIGKGITYTSIRNNATNFNNCLIPSMGTPDSDMLITLRIPDDPNPQIAIGRLSATNGDAIRQYLSKMIEYEGAQNDTLCFQQQIQDKQWMKRLLHLGGGKNAVEQAQFKIFLNNYRNIAQGPQFGGKVHSVFKTSTDPIQISTSELVDSLIDDGISLITFFGHSSTSTIDFDISPEEFENYGKYHVFLSNGCFVGSIFGTSSVTYSDRFIFQENTGSIAYIAPITLAVPSSLNFYSDGFYRRMSQSMYGATVGEIMKETADDMLNVYGPLEDLLGKQMILHGDPALRINSTNRPDYVINSQSISYDPEIVSASSDSFDVNILVTNLGRAIQSTYTVNIQRTFPVGGQENYSVDVPAALFKDTVTITLPTDRVNGLGANILRIKVDFGEEISELCETNNEVVDTLIIFSDDILPVQPYEFCIQNSAPEKLYFSTASITEAPKTYLLQIDTTEYFNSPLLLTNAVSSTGGIIEWSPPIPYIENTVYYVRSALDSLIQGDYNWNYSSFLYNTNLSTGWNQSHYFQFKKDDFFTLDLEEPDRRFEFSRERRSIRLINGIHNSPLAPQNQETYFDGNLLVRNSLSKASFNFFVFDVKTGKYLESLPDPNHPFSPCTIGTYASIHPCEFPDPRPVINFLANDPFWRFNAKTFIEEFIPDSAIVLVFTTQQSGSAFSLNVDEWANDTAVFADFPGLYEETIFDVFEDNLNSTKIRQIEDFHPYFLCTQKGNPDFPTMEFFGDPSEIIDTTHFFEGLWDRGALRSVRIGPSNGWNSVELDWNSLESPSYDEVTLNITGIDTLNQRDILFEGISDTSISLESINTDVYPHLEMELFASDDSARTAPQLKYWRVLFDKVPEAAVDPQLRFFSSADSIDIGQGVNLELGVTNISDLDMDSLLVKIQLNRPGSAPFSIYNRYGPLPARQSLIIPIELSDQVLTNTGNYTILVELNPDNDQPEQFHFNNYATFLLHINEDRINPLLDVTFDGVHILDGDIISPRPEIQVKLKDENMGLAIKDSGSIEMYLYYPDDPETAVFIDPASEDYNFVPADESELNEKNEAFVYYYPDFEQDGVYRLKVQGKDARNNEAGDYDYIVSFEVINESTISNFLNYPNPFSTSTRFVFTLTGAEVPEDIKIQILTVSGKVVREITRDELGPIRIGRNITEFAWDGTDRYGDPLANGLYIYKVITRLNGESLKQYQTSADKFFGKEGFGKMYIVR